MNSNENAEEVGDKMMIEGAMDEVEEVLFKEIGEALQSMKRNIALGVYEVTVDIFDAKKETGKHWLHRDIKTI